MTPRGMATCAAAGVAASGYWVTMSSRSQLFGPFPHQGRTQDGKQVALTFDDGPNEPYTSRLAALLEQRGVRATFFQVGQAVARYPDTTRALVAAGHVVGNHSYTHRLHRCVTSAAIDDEIRRTQDVLAETVGHRPRLFRPPWLARTPATFRVVRRHGLTAVSGTFCHPLEVAGWPSKRIAACATARTAPGRLLIFHDGYNGEHADRSRTLDAVARVIDTLGERGWSFTTVDAVLAAQASRFS